MEQFIEVTQGKKKVTINIFYITMFREKIDINTGCKSVISFVDGNKLEVTDDYETLKSLILR